MVRLKGKTYNVYFIICYVFQFQYGAIKGSFAPPVNPLINEFQFQYGAIKGQNF